MKGSVLDLWRYINAFIIIIYYYVELAFVTPPLTAGYPSEDVIARVNRKPLMLYIYDVINPGR